jgi:hypothetical protein
MATTNFTYNKTADGGVEVRFVLPNETFEALFKEKKDDGDSKSVVSKLRKTSWAEDTDDEKEKDAGWVRKVKKGLTKDKRELEKKRVEALTLDEVVPSAPGKKTVSKGDPFGIYKESQIIYGKTEVSRLFSDSSVFGGRKVETIPSKGIKKHNPTYFTPPEGDDYRVFVVTGMSRYRWYQAHNILFRLLKTEEMTINADGNLYLYNFKPWGLDAWFFAFHKDDAQTFNALVLTPLIDELRELTCWEHQYVGNTYYNNGVIPEVWDAMCEWNIEQS